MIVGAFAWVGDWLENANALCSTRTTEIFFAAGSIGPTQIRDCAFTPATSCQDRHRPALFSLPNRTTLQCINDPLGTTDQESVWPECRIENQTEKDRIMSTLNPSIRTTGRHEGETSRAGLLRRILDAIVEAKTLEARRRIAPYLQAASDQQLTDLGFTAADIASIRAGEPVGNILSRRVRQTS